MLCCVCTQSEREQIKIEKQTVVRAVISIYVFSKQHIVVRYTLCQITVDYTIYGPMLLAFVSCVAGGGGRRKMTRRKRQSEYLSNSIFRDGGRQRHMKMANKCWRHTLNFRKMIGTRMVCCLLSVFSSRRKISEKSVATGRAASIV